MKIVPLFVRTKCVFNTSPDYKLYPRSNIKSRNAVNLPEMINQQAGEKALHGQITKKMNALPLPIAK